MSKEKLMIQKVNVNPVTIEYWKNQMNENVKHLINRFLITMDDYDTTSFKIKDRTFTIFGMVPQGNIILKEMHNGEIIYWECNYKLAQYKLNRRYVSYEDNFEPVDYEMSELYLKHSFRKAKSVIVDDDMIIDEDNVDEVELVDLETAILELDEIDAVDELIEE